MVQADLVIGWHRERSDCTILYSLIRNLCHWQQSFCFFAWSGERFQLVFQQEWICNIERMAKTEIHRDYFTACSVIVALRIKCTNISFDTDPSFLWVIFQSHDLVNSLLNDKILDWFKLKAFSDDKLSSAEILKFVLGRQKTSWEKEKMLVTSIFFFSHNVFKKFLFHRC